MSNGNSQHNKLLQAYCLNCISKSFSGPEAISELCSTTQEETFVDMMKQKVFASPKKREAFYTPDKQFLLFSVLFSLVKKNIK